MNWLPQMRGRLVAERVWMARREVGQFRETRRGMRKEMCQRLGHALGQGVGADSSSFRMRSWPLEWKVPPVAVLASFMGFSGRKCVISVTKPVVERVFST